MNILGIAQATITKQMMNYMENDRNATKRRMEWIAKIKDSEWRRWEFKVEESDFEWVKCSFIGTTQVVELILIIQEKFYMEGYFSVSLKPIGGKLVLMQCANKE